PPYRPRRHRSAVPAAFRFRVLTGRPWPHSAARRARIRSDIGVEIAIARMEARKGHRQKSKSGILAEIALNASTRQSADRTPLALRCARLARLAWHLVRSLATAAFRYGRMSASGQRAAMR